jgi:Zn-finger nucleic acid-binding protein
VTVRAEDVSLSGCGACGGIWVDNASARSVLTNPLPVFADLARRASAGATGSRGKSEKPTCAECPAVLERSSVHGLELDVCSDHGTWFDALELDTLVKLLRHEPVTRAGAPAAVVSCQGCGQAIASDRANITDAGLRCESCWRAEQAADLARFDADNRTRGGIAVGGVLLGVAAVMLGAGSSNRS